jgi:hypothetical protein
MSGGYFDYKQYVIREIADQVEQLIRDNDDERCNEVGQRYGNFYNENTINEFKTGLKLFRKAAIYSQRIDWLVSGDDGEDDFHERIAEDLKDV